MMLKKLFYLGTFIFVQLIFIYLDNRKTNNFINADNQIQLTCFHEVGHFIKSECNDSCEFNKITIIRDSINLGTTYVSFYEGVSQNFEDRVYLSGKCTEFLFSTEKFTIQNLYSIYNFKSLSKNSDEYKVSYKEDFVKIKKELFNLYFDLKNKEKEIFLYSVILHDEKEISNLYYFEYLKNRLQLSNKIIKIWKSIF